MPVALSTLRRQSVPCDSGGGHADPRYAPSLVDLVEDLPAKGVVRHVADVSHGGDAFAGELIDRVGQMGDGIGPVNQGDGLDAPPHQFQRDGLADAAAGARDDRDFA